MELYDLILYVITSILLLVVLGDLLWTVWVNRPSNTWLKDIDREKRQ